jgi:predicted DCC family thiol-disulfide oxidoreductase YuxK
MQRANDGRFEVFYDGECPLCAREMRLVARLDRNERIVLTDIALPEFDASELGVAHDALMSEIHGRLSDGTLVTGVEVFRQLYHHVGFHRLVAVSRWPGLRQALDLGYRLFAKNRLRLTGRCHDGVCQV